MNVPVGVNIRRRRTLLTTVGGAIGILLAGCIGDNSGGDDQRNDDWDADEHDSETSTPPEGFPDSCPEYDRVADVVCYDVVDTDEAEGYLEPSPRTLTVDESIEFSLRNESDRILETNFYSWAVHKYVNCEWYHVAPREWPQPLMHLAPGDTHTWSLSVENEGVLAGEPVSRAGGTESVTVQGLGGGYYAFRGRGWFEDESHERAIAFAAMFELDTDPISLVPTDAIEHTEWDSDTLVAKSSRGDTSEHPLAAYTLERVEESAAESQPLITEQVYRNHQLRDVLALAREHDADTVRLEEHTGSRPPFAMSPEGRIAFQGDTYEITTEKLE